MVEAELLTNSNVCNLPRWTLPLVGGSVIFWRSRLLLTSTNWVKAKACYWLTYIARFINSTISPDPKSKLTFQTSVVKEGKKAAKEGEMEVAKDGMKLRSQKMKPSSLRLSICQPKEKKQKKLLNRCWTRTRQQVKLLIWRRVMAVGKYLRCPTVISGCNN